jgi:Nuclease-related domain
VAYDIDRKPAEYLSEQVARRTRTFWLLMAAYATGFVFAAALWMSGQHLATGVIVAAMGCFALAARFTADAAAPWIKGHSAEASVGAELNALRTEGYLVMHDFMFGGEGNIDHLAVGPNGAFLVETKYRRYTEAQLGRAKRQAVKLHDELGCWVTPVICAGTRDKTYFHRRVLITGNNNVVEAIRAQSARGKVDMERVRRFADSLS